MQTVQTTPAIILDHHLQAFIHNNLDELLEDYTEASEIWTPNGVIAGLESIAAFYQYVFTLFPKGSTQLELKQNLVNGNKAYIVWSAHSLVVHIPVGTDSFEFYDGKIVWQSTAAQINPRPGI